MKDVIEKEIFNETSLVKVIPAKKKIKFNVEVNEKYDILNIMLMFFGFAMAGYVIEVIWMFMKQGIIVNRGTLVGPWLPIYGYGAVVILLLFSSNSFKKISKNPVLTFFLIMVMASIAEYITSLVLEIKYGMRWWDYSNEKFNINGRVCLENTILFGLAGTLCLYVIGPALNRFLKKIPLNIRITFLTIFLILFTCDNLYCKRNPNTGLGITEEKVFVPALRLFKK